MKQSPFNNNEYVATGSLDNAVKIWSIPNWTLIRTYSGHTSYVYATEWINSDTIASGSDDRTIKIWSISNGQTNRTINIGSSIRSLQIFSNGYYLAAGLSNNQINLHF
jgi:WD40 repeat protein